MKSRILLICLLAAALCSCRKDKYVANVTDLRIINILPASGYSGQIVKILGRNFSDQEDGNNVTIGGKTARILDYNCWDLTVVLPEHTPGQYDVEVSTATQTAGGIKFAYVDKPEHVYLSSIYAGAVGSAGTVDAQGAAARFAQPEGISIAPDGSLYVLQRGVGNMAIRRIDANGNVSTLSNDAALNYPWHGDFAPDGTYYFANKGNSKIMKYTGSQVSEVVIGGAEINNPMECKFDASGNMYIVNRNANQILKTAANAVVATYEIPMPASMAILPDGRIVVGTTSDGYLYMIGTDGSISKIAGCGSTGSALGNGVPGNLLDTSCIGMINGMCCDSEGNLYLCDVTSLSVRKLTPGTDGDYSKGKLESLCEGFYPSDIKITPNGGKLYVTSATGAKSHTIIVIEII